MQSQGCQSRASVVMACHTSSRNLALVRESEIGHIVLGDDRRHFHAVTVLLTADTISFRPDIDDVDIHADPLFQRDDLLDAGLRHVIERDPVDCYAHPLRKGQAKLWTG